MAKSDLPSADSISAGSALDPRFCALFDGVCAVCPNHVHGVRRNRTRKSIETVLPPFADAAIAALTRCRKLTRREIEVLTLVCTGAKNEVIASMLGISLSAVRRHLCHLHAKTTTSDKAELILNLWYSCRGESGRSVESDRSTLTTPRENRELRQKPPRNKSRMVSI